LRTKFDTLTVTLRLLPASQKSDFHKLRFVAYQVAML
jgi:hypothetical protein